ncbi:hypothetical protein [Oceanobacillus massiliensis]|nr:hypothetical protein [Oceanobacillus massiliensis]
MKKIFFFLILLTAAGLLDIKYKGMLYRQLPASFQDRLNEK